jgi:hypothetical protein
MRSMTGWASSRRRTAVRSGRRIRDKPPLA